MTWGLLAIQVKNNQGNRMGWVFYSLLAATLWAIVNVTDKYTMGKLVDNPMIPLLILGFVGLLAAGAVYCVHGIVFLSPFDSTLAFLAGLFYVLTMLFYYLALKYEEVSKVIPVFYLSPVFIILIAKEVLGENLVSHQYWGIAFLVCGAMLISLPTPLKLGVGKGISYILLAAFCYAINQVLTKFLLKNNAFWPVFAYIRIGIFLSLLPVFGWNIGNIIHSCKKIHYQAYGIMIINQLLNVMGVFSITLAMTTGYVTLVNGLASAQPFFVLVFSTALGLFFPNLLNERLQGWVLIKKLIAIFFIILGVLKIS